MADPSTIISGTKYSMTPLRGREARTVGLLVTSATLRGIAAVVSKTDLSKLLKQLPDLSNLGEEGKGAQILANLSWPEIAAALGGLADGGATLLEMLGAEGMETLTSVFTSQCTVWAHAPSDPARTGATYPVPLANQDDHWVGKWPQFIQWLIWGVKVNGFFPELPGLAASPTLANGSAGVSGSAAPTAST